MSERPFSPHRPKLPSPVPRRPHFILGLIGAVALATGCTMEPPGDASEPPHSESTGALAGLNGLTPNGLITNGLITNGLITNGLITNGLITNGLGTLGVTSPTFSAWFSSNPAAYSDMVMRYVVACAYPQGSSLTYWDALTWVTYTWHGRLGLTPGWASGLPILRAEEQLISACLAAHVNKYGINMEVSVRGETAVGTPLPVTQEEAAEFIEKEAAFFGNLFTGEGVFACSERSLNKSESSARACGLVAQSAGMSVECPPIQHVGGCGVVCTFDKLRGYHTRCTVNGIAYTPLTTRLRSSDIYRCGDGTCQLSESCDPDPRSTGTRYDACESDCGNCPQ